jgi:hypothetical protein
MDFQIKEVSTTIFRPRKEFITNICPTGGTWETWNKYSMLGFTCATN